MAINAGNNILILLKGHLAIYKKTLQRHKVQKANFV